jgi:hypothetical protein
VASIAEDRGAPVAREDALGEVTPATAVVSSRQRRATMRANADATWSRIPGLLMTVAFLAAAGCSEDAAEEVGVTLNWTIVSATSGSVECVDVDAATVEWTFDGELTVAPLTYTYDCADGSGSVVIPVGAYAIAGKLKRGDSVTLATCYPDVPSSLTPEDNQIGPCEFEVP